MGETVAQFEELLQVVDQLLPEWVQREDDGTGGGGSTDVGVGGDGDDSPPLTGAARRAAAKRKGQELHADNRGQQKEARKTARVKEAEQTANKCVSSALSSLSGLFPPATGGGNKWRDITDEADSASAQLDLRLKQAQAYEDFSNRLAKVMDGDPGGVSVMARFYKKELLNLERAMFPQAADAGAGEAGAGAGATVEHGVMATLGAEGGSSGPTAAGGAGARDGAEDGLGSGEEDDMESEPDV